MMKTIVENRIFVIILALAGILAIGALASGIQGMEFREPDPFYFEWPGSSGVAIQSFARQMDEIPIEQVILFWTTILVITGAVLLILNPNYRWKIFLVVLRTAIMFTLLTWGMKAVARNLSENFDASSSSQQSLQLGSGQGSPPVFTPPATAPWLSFIIGLVLILGTLLLAWWLWNMGTHSRNKNVRQNLAAIARDTLDEIADGRDFYDTVTNCYMRMIDTVSSGRGILRQETMTPAEFANKLDAAGLPGEPVHRLTRLFEAVRYGAKKPGQVETSEAVSCLNAIVTACGAVE